MRYSKLFGKTRREAPSSAESINHKLLTQAGFIDRLMAGSYTFLPLGWRVEQKIEQIIREEINATGAQEMLMPLLHPKNIWNETGRWESAREVMYQFKKDGKEYALSFTHEEIVMDLVRKHIQSKKDLPVKIYHFSTKFRNEARAKSGILRLREFIMKDLYSAHATEEDLTEYYWQVKDAYMRIFERLGLKAILTEASGGVFTKGYTHEFQILSEIGEDVIYICNGCSFAINKEIFVDKADDFRCSKCGNKDFRQEKAIEVGNIFPLGTSYSEKMGAYFTDKTGTKKPVWFASYGIGPSRLIGVLAEIYHDQKGLLWPKSVAPFAVCLIGIESGDKKNREKAEKIYEVLEKANMEVLYDDREDISVGEKFADADLIGLPVRLVISSKTGDKIELKNRNSQEVFMVEAEEAIKFINNL